MKGLICNTSLLSLLSFFPPSFSLILETFFFSDDDDVFFFFFESSDLPAPPVLVLTVGDTQRVSCSHLTILFT